MKSKIYDIIDLYGKITENDNIRKESDKNTQIENRLTQKKKKLISTKYLSKQKLIINN